MTQLKFVFGDPEICSGCMICANVCSMYYFKVISPTRSRVRVMRIEPALDFPLFCRNCKDAPCIDACPERALSRTSKGIVIVNNSKCNGTGMCVKACPYNAIHINPDTGKAIKCIQCGQCVDRCPADALFLTTDEDLANREDEGRMMELYEKHKEELYSKEEGF
ncbi:MAG: 4Fe-4S dicluster domain-containing protein [Candidatus Thorarchaeota archaeon]|nr:4Fe-4S dicluster domain-containing protein [Candidatus Thorarchaeota archaeon]